MAHFPKYSEFLNTANHEDGSLSENTVFPHGRARRCFDITTNPGVRRGGAEVFPTAGQLIEALRKDRSAKGTTRIKCHGKNQEAFNDELARVDDRLVGFDRRGVRVTTPTCESWVKEKK